MPDYTNHLVDPAWFDDCILEYQFTYTIYVVGEEDTDDLGKLVKKYKKQEIVGSLQSQGLEVRKSTSGNISVWKYKFYCKSLYRINIGDIIEYKDKYLIVTSVHDYDEYGVRNADLSSISLAAHRDFREYLKYLSGEKTI